jgi:hypothetical protein
MNEDKTKAHYLVQAIDYRIDYMDTWAGSRFNESPGMIVHVVETDTELIGIPPEDDYNLTCCLNQPCARIVGRGILIEKISSYWFVAWRPYTPSPEFNYDLMVV